MSGIVVVGVSIWTIIWKHQYVSLLSTFNYIFITYCFLTAGAIALITGFLGCCGVWREHRAMILGVSLILSSAKNYKSLKN